MSTSSASSTAIGRPFPFPATGSIAATGRWSTSSASTPTTCKGLEDYVGEIDIDSLGAGGSVDHIAFRASDFAGMRQRLDDMSVDYVERKVPEMDLRQLFLKDPNGVMVELNYVGEGAAQTEAA